MKYLKCLYYNGMFPDEYLITLKVNAPISQNWYWVNRDDVIPIDENSGLVKLVSLEEGEKTSFVGINNLGDHRISFFNILNEMLETR